MNGGGKEQKRRAGNRKIESLGHPRWSASDPWAVEGDFPLLIPGLSFVRADATVGF